MEHMTREQFLETELRGLNKVKKFITHSPTMPSMKEFSIQLDAGIKITEAELELRNAKKKKIRLEEARIQEIRDNCVAARETYRVLYKMNFMDREDYESVIQDIDRIIMNAKV